MQKIIRQILALCFFMVFVAGCSSFLVNQNNIEQELARNDIHFMTRTILKNHPGPKNNQDPAFMNVLEMANQEALAGAKKVSSVKERVALLKKYVEHFHDGHLNIFFNLDVQQDSSVIVERQRSNDFELREFMPGVVWVTLPRFWTKNQEEVEKLHNIIAQMPKFRSNRLIIFDVRGNGGGSSSWGSRMLEALFGKEYVKRKEAEATRDVYVEWRVSKGNIEHLQRDIENKKKQFGAQSGEVAWAIGQHRMMEKAFDKGAFFCSEHDDCITHDDSFDRSSAVMTCPQKMCSAKIIVIIDKHCFSSTLMFLDELRNLDHPVLFVGQTTGADTCYGDSRDIRLPSDIGSFTFPMRVWRNRKRGSNQPYHPDVIYPGDINDTQALGKWLKLCYA